MSKNNEKTKTVRIPLKHYAKICEMSNRGDFRDGMNRLMIFYNQVHRNPQDIIKTRVQELQDDIERFFPDLEVGNLVPFFLKSLREGGFHTDVFQVMMDQPQQNESSKKTIQLEGGSYQ